MLPAFPQFVAVLALIVTSGRYVESQAPEVAESCDAFCQQDSQVSRYNSMKIQSGILDLVTGNLRYEFDRSA